MHIIYIISPFYFLRIYECKYVCIRPLHTLTCAHCRYRRAPPPTEISSPPTTMAAVIPKVSSPYVRQPVSHVLAPAPHTHTQTHTWSVFQVCKMCVSDVLMPPIQVEVSADFSLRRTCVESKQSESSVEVVL